MRQNTGIVQESQNHKFYINLSFLIGNQYFSTAKYISEIPLVTFQRPPLFLASMSSSSSAEDSVLGINEFIFFCWRFCSWYQWVHLLLLKILFLVSMSSSSSAEDSVLGINEFIFFCWRFCSWYQWVHLLLLKILFLVSMSSSSSAEDSEESFPAKRMLVVFYNVTFFLVELIRVWRCIFRWKNDDIKVCKNNIS